MDYAWNNFNKIIFKVILQKWSNVTKVTKILFYPILFLDEMVFQRPWLCMQLTWAHLHYMVESQQSGSHCSLCEHVGRSEPGNQAAGRCEILRILTWRKLSFLLEGGTALLRDESIVSTFTELLPRENYVPVLGQSRKITLYKSDLAFRDLTWSLFLKCIGFPVFF